MVTCKPSNQIYFDILFKDSTTTWNSRGGSRAAATFKLERFVIIVNGWKPLTIITKHSIFDVAAVLDPPLNRYVSNILYGNI